MALATAVLLLASLPAAGQHPLPPRHKPLFERVALSDAVALGRVLRIEAGRLRVERVRGLLGELPDEFEVKRSPLRPDACQVDDLCVFFLRGAREPYVQADAAPERIRLGDPAAARRLADALADLIAAGSDRERLLALHRGWLGADDPLRGLALDAFLHPAPPFGPLTPASARELARAATEPDRGLEERRASALVAMLHAEGLEQLIESLPGPAGAAQADVSARALRMAALRGSRGTADALRRTLSHPDPEIRRVGLDVLGELLRREEGASPVGRETVARIAREDPDPEARQRAARALELLDR